MNRHVAEVENLYRQMRGWRHDYHNHIQMMKAYRALGQDDRLDAYLDELEQDLKGFDVLIRSGTGLIDGIIDVDLFYDTYLESLLNGLRTVNIYVLE